MNMVRRDSLTDGCETLQTKDAVLPTLGDANGRPLWGTYGELDKFTEGPEQTVERILQHRVAAGDDQL